MVLFNTRRWIGRKKEKGQLTACWKVRSGVRTVMVTSLISATKMRTAADNMVQHKWDSDVKGSSMARQVFNLETIAACVPVKELTISGCSPWNHLREQEQEEEDTADRPQSRAVALKALREAAEVQQPVLARHRSAVGSGSGSGSGSP